MLAQATETQRTAIKLKDLDYDVQEATDTGTHAEGDDAAINLTS